MLLKTMFLHAAINSATRGVACNMFTATQQHVDAILFNKQIFAMNPGLYCNYFVLFFMSFQSFCSKHRLASLLELEQGSLYPFIYVYVILIL